MNRADAERVLREMGVRGELFLSRFEEAGDCWLWAAGRNADGYGLFAVQRDGRWMSLGAHRFAYEALVGPIPSGKQLDHLCRNRACVRPDHLEPVTNRENSQRGVDARPRATTCTKGHPRTADNCRTRPDGQVVCKVCRREAEAARRATNGYPRTRCPLCDKDLRADYLNRHLRDVHRQEAQGAA